MTLLLHCTADRAVITLSLMVALSTAPDFDRAP